MRSVWKFPLTTTRQKVKIPQPGIVRCVAWQDGNPTVWAEVDTEQAVRERTFLVVPTGSRWDPEHEMVYLGTAMGESLVFHVYELVA